MVTGVRPLITIGCKYNAWKVISFIVTDNTGGTQTCTLYLSKYTDQFTNVSIFLLLVPLSYISSLGQLMRLNPTTNQGSLIWLWRSYGLLSVVEYGYIHHFLG